MVVRRTFLKQAAALAAVPAALRAESPAQTGIVRIASVKTALEGGVLPTLAQSFQAETGLAVTFWGGEDPYGQAEAGHADLVVSHFGHRDVESFVTQGLGLWPRTIFSNQHGLFGPSTDPAGVRGLGSLVEAFRRIARTQSPFVVNELPGLTYLTDILWHASGKPPKGSWYRAPGVDGREAMALAVRENAYVLWGLTPFVRDQASQPATLTALVTSDPLSERLMVSVVVDPRRVDGVNAAGAKRFQDFLIAPSTQARLFDIHYPGVDQAVWTPSGIHNAGHILSG